MNCINCGSDRLDYVVKYTASESVGLNEEFFHEAELLDDENYEINGAHVVCRSCGAVDAKCGWIVDDSDGNRHIINMAKQRELLRDCEAFVNGVSSRNRFEDFVLVDLPNEFRAVSVVIPNNRKSFWVEFFRNGDEGRAGLVMLVRPSVGELISGSVVRFVIVGNYETREIVLGEQDAMRVLSWLLLRDRGMANVYDVVDVYVGSSSLNNMAFSSASIMGDAFRTAAQSAMFPVKEEQDDA